MSPLVRSATALAIVAVIGVIAAAAALIGSSTEPPDGEVPTARTEESGSPAAADLLAAAAWAAPPGEGPRPPSFETPGAQHRTWHSDGIWWAALPDFAGGEIVIMRLDPDAQAWVDTGTLLDQRIDAQVDVWAHDRELWVASAGGPETDPIEPTVARYLFDPELERYEIQPDVPVALDDARAESITLVVDGDGAAWASWLVEDRLRISRSTDGHAWTDVDAPGAAAGVIIDAASLALTGDGRAALTWTESAADHISFVVLDDAEGGGTPEELTIPGLEAGGEALSVVTAEDGRVFIGIGTDADRDESTGPLDADVFVAVRETDGSWRAHLIARVTDRREHPFLMIDEGRDLLLVATTSRREDAQIAVQMTPLDRIAFDPGGGVVAFASVLDAGMSGLAGPRSPIGLEAQPVLVSGTETPRHIIHAVLADAGTELPPTDRPVGEPSVVPTSGTLVAQTFDRQAAGRPPAGWDVSLPTEGSTSVTVVEGDGTDLVMELATLTGTNRPEACRELPALPEAVMTVGFRWWVGDPGDKPATVTIGGSEGELGSLEFTTESLFVSVENEQEIVLGPAYVAGRWYRVEITVDAASSEIRWLFADEASGSVVLDTVRPSAEAGAPAELCVRAPTNDAEVPDVFGSAALLDAFLIEATSTE